MLSAQALVTKYDLKASLGHKGNVNKEKHINFFKYICVQLLTLLTVRVGWEALQILGECITRKTGILVIFHEKIATSETYCETFDKTFENETHGSHTEILQAIEDATMNFRKTDTKSLFAFHIFTQVKHLNTVNNLVLSTAIKHKLTMNSDKATELHCITHCMIAPMKPVNGVIAFSIDCNGEPMQSVSKSNLKEALGHKKSNRDWLKDHKLFKGTLGSNQDLAGIIPFNQWLWPGCYSPAEPKENREVPTPTCFVQARVMAIIPIFQALFDGSTNGLFTLFEQWQYQYLNDYKNGRGSNVKLSKVNKTAMKIRGLFSGYLNKYVRKIFPKPQRAIYLSLHKRRLRWNTFRRGTKTVQNNQSVSNDNESPNEENKNEESMEGKRNDSPNAEETNETLNASNNNDNNVNVSQTENSSNSQSMEQSNVTVAPDPSFPGFLQHLRNTPSQNESMNTDQNESNNNSNSSNKNKKNEGTGNMAMNTDSEEHSDKESAKASDKSDDDENELDSDVSDEVITNIPKKQLRGRRSKRLAAKNKPKKKSQTKNRRVKDKSKKKMPKGHRPSKTHASKKSSPLQCLGPEKLMADHKITRKLKKMSFCKLKNNIKKN